MNAAEAQHLTQRIVNTWRSGPDAREWADELATLDEGAAGTTFARLRRSLDHAPTIKRFLDEYHALDVGDAGTIKPVCGDCDSSGWVAAPDYVMHGRDGSEVQRYSQARPCSYCPIGKQATGSSVWKYRTRSA